MAPRKSNAKKMTAQSSRFQEPFLPFGTVGGGQGLEQLTGYVADELNEHGPTIMVHAHENTGRGARDAWVFFCFLVEAMVPPMSRLLHAVLSTYGVVLVHLHPNALLALAIFQHLCEAYVGVRTSVALIRIIRAQ
jgi:hypothetical protein